MADRVLTRPEPTANSPALTLIVVPLGDGTFSVMGTYAPPDGIDPENGGLRPDALTPAQHQALHDALAPAVTLLAQLWRYR